jgi:hypothetical protein
MRSNDIVLGFTNDVFQFTMMQECLLVQLLKAYPDLKLGHYYHNAGSMHVYSRHYEMAEKIIADEKTTEMPMVPMDKFDNEIIGALCKCEEAWQLALAPADFDFSTVKAFKKLTPYWQNLVKFCFVDDHEATHAVFGIPE